MQISRADIYNAVIEYLALIEIGKSNAEENLQTLEMVLDKLALAYHYSEHQFDEADYPDALEAQKKWHKLASQRFPDFGYYNMPISITQRIGESEWGMGDAIDDLGDIAKDLQEVAWCWQNTSIEDALWHFRFGFESHWGEHLRFLQLYIRAFKNKL
jgi:hypothetical protein